jgi:hypothetical protein
MGNLDNYSSIREGKGDANARNFLFVQLPDDAEKLKRMWE